MGNPTAISNQQQHSTNSARNTLSYLRSIFFTNNLIYLYTALMGTLSLVGSLFDARGRWQHWFADGPPCRIPYSPALTP